MGDDGGVRAIVITGAPGAGKSSALTALSDLLGDEGAEHVTVELDDLKRGHPYPGMERGIDNLAAFAAVQRTGLMLVAATLTSPAEVGRLLAAVGCDDHFLVRLHARPETLVRRVRARETIPWSGLEPLIARTPSLQATIATLPGVHLALSTERAAPQELARTIRSASSRARSTRSATSDFD